MLSLRRDGMIKAAILGSTGYAGAELVKILSMHPDAEVVYPASHSYAGKRFSDIYPGMRGICDLVLQEDDIDKAAECADVIFLALPAGLASKLVTEKLLEKCVVIDLGADYRLHDKAVYEKWYKTEHHSLALLNEAVYGLPEIHRDAIKGKRLIANPGCYTTCSIMTLYPLVKNGLIDTGNIIIDAKSGTSGAGRGEKLGSLFCEVNESIKPYGVTTHRHTPEIEQELSEAAGKSLMVEFTPHLVPMNRGILSVCYARLKDGVSESDVKNAYEEAYGNEKFVRLIDALPETRYVKGTNLVDISYRINERTGNIVAMGAIDNLVKGAAGQAVQNMNIVFGCDEAAGLSCGAAMPL